MRPAGEIRRALRAAANALRAVAMDTGGITYRDLAVASQVGFDEARVATKNMVKEGELMPCGTRQVPGSRRPLTTYMPASNDGAAHAGADLAQVLGGWASAA